MRLYGAFTFLTRFQARSEVVQGIQMDDRSFDMVNLSTWEDQIMYDSTT